MRFLVWLRRLIQFFLGLTSVITKGYQHLVQSNANLGADLQVVKTPPNLVKWLVSVISIITSKYIYIYIQRFAAGKYHFLFYVIAGAFSLLVVGTITLQG